MGPGAGTGGLGWPAMLFVLPKGDNLLGRSTVKGEMLWGPMPLAMSISTHVEPGLALVTPTSPGSTDASSPQGCILQEHFDARLHLEAEVIFYGVKGCSRGHPSTSATHIIHLQPEPRYHTVPVVGPQGGGWDMLGNAWEGVGVSNRQTPHPSPHPSPPLHPKVGTGPTGMGC